MTAFTVDYDNTGVGSIAAAGDAFLPPEYNFTLFFSLPFYPRSKVYKKSLLTYGHLTLALGSTAYQLHDPARLSSSFLVSRMPLANWLFSDGAWFDWDPASPTYRHVHLYEKSEVSRTVVFFVAARNFPAEKLIFYQRYIESIERRFQNGGFRFHLLCNNCTQLINRICYREGWFKRGPFDFIPVVAFKRLVAAWKALDTTFVAGHFQASDPALFRPHSYCLGLFTHRPARELAGFVARKP